MNGVSVGVLFQPMGILARERGERGTPDDGRDDRGLLERWIHPAIGGFGQIGRLLGMYVNAHDTPIGDK